MPTDMIMWSFVIPSIISIAAVIVGVYVAVRVKAIESYQAKWESVDNTARALAAELKEHQIENERRITALESRK